MIAENNGTILDKAKAAIIRGDNEGFLSFCTDDTEWIFVGDKARQLKKAVRQWMATTFVEPPKFMLENLIAAGDFVYGTRDNHLKDEDGKTADYAYCDVWQFHNGKMAALNALVIKAG